MDGLLFAGGWRFSRVPTGALAALLVVSAMLVALAWPSQARADSCAATCNAEYEACRDFFCDPLTSGCSHWCFLIYTVTRNGCFETCQDSAGQCRTSAHEDLRSCWRACWPVVKGNGPHEACMEACTERHASAAKACEAGAVVPPTSQPPSSPPTAGPGGDATSAEDWRTIIALGRPFRLILDGTQGKFDDSRYTGNHRTDPLGTIKGGEAYTMAWHDGTYQGTGFNQGTGQRGTWSSGGADPRAGTLSLWGERFTFTPTGQVMHGKWGYVGHLEQGGRVSGPGGTDVGDISRIVAHLRAGRPVLVDLDSTARYFDDSVYSGDYRTDPLGTLKGGEQYVVILRGDGFETMGYNQGSNGFGRWRGFPATPENGELSVWGVPFTFDSAGAVHHPQYGRVGTLYGP